MNRVVQITTIALISLIVGVALYWRRERAPAPLPTSTQPPLSSGLEISSADLNFGVAWATSDFSHRLSITNRRPSATRIRRVAGSCACSSFTPSEFTILAGQTISIEARLDLTPGLTQTEIPLRPFSVALWVEMDPQDGFASREQWTLVGQVRSALAVPHTVELVNNPTFIPISRLWSWCSKPSRRCNQYLQPAAIPHLKSELNAS